MKKVLAGSAVIAALGMTACGGSKGNVGATTTATVAAHQTPTITQPGTAEADLSPVAQNLTAAGFEVTSDDVSGTAVESLRATKGGADLHVVSYRSAADAKPDYDAIAKVFEEKKGRGVAKLVGTYVFWIAQERKLTSAERSLLSQAIDAADVR